jgi:hypothetical protein
MMRKQHIDAIADERRASNGVAVVASVQTLPETRKPYHVRGVSFTDKTERHIDLRLTDDEARKLVEDWVSMGLFGKHGRVVKTEKAG